MLVELLKDFWNGYLKKLGENAGGAHADTTTKGIKDWFVALVHKEGDDATLTELVKKIHQLTERKKLNPK